MYKIFEKIYMISDKEFENIFTNRQNELWKIIKDSWKNKVYDLNNFINFMNEMVPQRKLKTSHINNDKYYNGFITIIEQNKNKINLTEHILNKNIIHCMSLNNLHGIFINDIKTITETQNNMLKTDLNKKINNHVYLTNLNFNYNIKRAEEIIVPDTDFIHPNFLKEYKKSNKK
jgi:hypothetical protein